MPFSEFERRAAFFLVCVPIRSAIAALFLLAPLYGMDALLRVLGSYALFTAANMCYYAVLTARGEYTTGGTGGEVWWANLRYLHIALWSTAGVAALLGQAWAGWALVTDVSIGFLGGVARYSTGVRL